MTETLSEDEGIIEIESACLNCHENGMSRLLLVKIPFFKDIVVSSFHCEHCNNENRSIEFCQALNDKGGCIITFKVFKLNDLNRQIILSEYSTLHLIELDFTIPPSHAKSVTLKTIEGVLFDIIENLNTYKNSLVQSENEDLIEKLEGILNRLNKYSHEPFEPFTLKIEDPSGNSMIEQYLDEQQQLKDVSDSIKKNEQIHIQWYERDNAMLEQMGFKTSEVEKKNNSCINSERFGYRIDTKNLPKQLKYFASWDLNKSFQENLQTVDKFRVTEKQQLNSKEQLDDNSNENERMNNNEHEQFISSLPAQCSQCGTVGTSEMCTVDVPGFRSSLIMSFLCEHCGARSNEIKPMGEYGDKAKKWILNVESVEDLNRDIIASHLSKVSLPDIDFEITSASSGGVFTTIEGYIKNTIETLKSNSFLAGDSATSKEREIFKQTLEKLESYIDEKNPNLPFRFILYDPVDLSMISGRLTEHIGLQNFVTHSDDKQLQTILSERTIEENDELGFLDMKTENYE